MRRFCFRALEMVRERVEAGERQASVLIDAAKAMIAATPGAKIDYIAVADWETLEPIEELDGEVLVALACHFWDARG